MGVKHREKAKGVGVGSSSVGGRTGRRKQREQRKGTAGVGWCGRPDLESRRGRVTLVQPHAAGAPLCPRLTWFGWAVAPSRPKHRNLGLPRRKHGRSRRSSPLFPCCKPTKQDTINAHGTCSGNPQRGSKIFLLLLPALRVRSQLRLRARSQALLPNEPDEPSPSPRLVPVFSRAASEGDA